MHAACDAIRVPATFSAVDAPRHLVAGLLAPRRLRGRGWAWFAVYLALCAAILGATARLLAAYKGDLVELVTRYLFPGDWRFAGHMLIERFIEAQDRTVLVNGAIAASLMVVQILLFPVKEQLSATFERQARPPLTDEPQREFPLWFQAWEEVKLFLIFVAAQGSIFWIGYATDPARKQLATALSYLFLFASFGIDFLTPVLQRHQQRYSTMLKTLALHPVTVLGFGALFTLPPVLVGQLVARHSELAFSTAAGALFAANVVTIAWAAVAGTHVGAQLLPDARRTRRPAPITRLAAWALLLGVLGWNGYRFGAVGLALHHKSQILKCRYDLEWTSIRVDRPGVLGLASGLGRDEIEVGVSFDVTIENPTAFDVVIEENRLEATHLGTRVAESRLTPVTVPAGGKTSAAVRLPLRLHPSQLMKGRDLLRGGDWAITLWLEVADGFWFPIYILEAEAAR
jgi:hypothetical protein